MKGLSQLEKTTGIKFKNKDLLIQAITHRSYLNEHPEFKLDHNERLEFLGDAVLELVVTEYLYKHYSNPEGELTNWRASLVNGANLAKIAQLIGLEPFIMMSRGEKKDTNTKARQYILANAMEAIIGAIYLDQGIKEAKKFIDSHILGDLKQIIENKLYIDPKSRFQEKAQELFGVTPSYKVLAASGPDHNKIFKVGVFINAEMIAQGTGSSKQEAQVEAARAALHKKKWNQ
ncbi:MAG TPA: ribonuclease III [bacterium]|nr:ribonuclease III [bacterium]HNS33970.1 ribonuclease III [bacterium]HNZ73191.1 ribonuclease III [bacterium]HOH66927.1 ribonuclease III [bacterium]HQA63506.1 ribonuclease III [bacterium]